MSLDCYQLFFYQLSGDKKRKCDCFRAVCVCVCERTSSTQDFSVDVVYFQIENRGRVRAFRFRFLRVKSSRENGFFFKSTVRWFLIKKTQARFCCAGGYSKKGAVKLAE